MPLLRKVDEAVQGSFIGRYFEMEERKTTFSIELKGAVATFMTMAYILAVNPRILADSGGPCVPDDEEYELCLEEVCFVKIEFPTLYDEMRDARVH